ncbi:MAG: TolC family protein [Sulfurovum sp.]
MQKLLLYLLFSSAIYALSLPQLIDVGLTNSNIIKKSKADIEYSRAKRNQSRANSYGKIELVANYTHFNTPRTLAPVTPSTMKDPSVVVPTTKDLFGTGISYSVPLFTGFAQSREIEIDMIAEDIAKSKHSLTKEQLVYNISSLYLSTLAMIEMVSAQKSYLNALNKLNRQIEIEVDLGKKSQIDLLKAQSDIEGNRAYLKILRSNIIISKASLASLVGVKKIKRLKSIRVKVKRPRYNISNIMDRTSNLNRVKISNLSLIKAHKNIQKSNASKLPQVSLNSYYGYNYGINDSSNANSGDWDKEETWQVGVNAKRTIMDFGKSRASTQMAKIAYIKASLEQKQTLLDFKKSIIEASEKIKQEYASYIANVKQLRLAKKSEKIERVRYQNDAITLNDLLYAKSKTHIAKAKLIESRYNYQKGKFYMDYLMERGEKR